MRITLRRTAGWTATAAALGLLTALSGCASTSMPPAGGSSAGSSSAGSSSAGSSSGGSVESAASSSSVSSAALSARSSSSGSAATADLVGQTFVATEVTGAYKIVPGSTVSLTFEGDTLSARAGCNTMFGAYTVSGDVLDAPQLASTMMACEPALMAQDAWLTKFLASSPTWTYADSALTLTNGTDTMKMSSAPGGVDALEGTGWRLDGLVSKSGSTVTAVDPSSTAWIRFSGGEVAYNTSCNGGGGEATIGDDTLTFGALRSTMIFCDGASGQTEAAMNAVLQGTTNYTIKEDPSGALLTITSADGKTGLQFVADPTAGAEAFASMTMSPEPTASSTG